MEALLLAFLGFLLLYPCIQFHRTGDSVLLRLSVALSLPFVIAVLFFMPQWREFIWPGTVAYEPAGLELSRAYLWTFASVSIAAYYLCVVLHYVIGRGTAKSDRWAVLEARMDGLLAAGDTEGALGLFDKALKSDPSDFRGHFRFGKLLYRTGYIKRASEHFLLAVENAPVDSRPEIVHEAERVLGARKTDEPTLEQFRRLATRFISG